MISKLVRTKIKVPDQQMLRDRLEEDRKEKIRQADHFKRKILSLFPLKANISKEIISSANIQDGRQCTGALTLKKALEVHDIDGKNVGWGTVKGFIHPYFEVTTKEGIDMEKVHDITTVTFMLTNEDI